jgi:hypothetical protein
LGGFLWTFAIILTGFAEFKDLVYIEVQTIISS